MITWMQRHKKWLIITIWISTIAFVGAGFVGWGSYNYGKSDGAIAVVGKKEIPLSDLQTEYSNLYGQYQNMLGGQFNQELAKQFQLEEIALQRVIQKYLFLNYADELGLITTDIEVAKEIVKIPSFFKDGKFDKDTYMSLLKQNRTTVTEFEKQLKQDLLVQKVQKIFHLPLEKNELSNITNLVFSEDTVSIKIINDSSIKISPTFEELQKYWEENKANYQSKSGFNLSYYKVANIEGKDAKEMKQEALREYLELKKGNLQFQTNEIIYEDSQFLSPDELKQLADAKNDEILKPILKDDSYYVFKLNKKVSPQPLPFEEVKSQINKEYIQKTKNEELEKLALKSLENFKGEPIGVITRASEIEIKGLQNDEVSQLIQAIFSSNQKRNYFNLGDKIVIFEIESSNFVPVDEKNIESILASLESAKTNALNTALLEKLQNKYDVKSYLKK